MRNAVSIALFGFLTVWGFTMTPADGAGGSLAKPLDVYRAELRKCYGSGNTARVHRCRRETRVNFGWEERLVHSAALFAPK